MDLDRLWLEALQEVVNRAAHELKDSLNGVSLNLEVVRSRASSRVIDMESLAAFSTSAAEQLELLSLRAEAVLFLARPARDTADVAVTLRHLAALLVPATRAEGGRLTVQCQQVSAPTTASARATRLALAATLLRFTDNGGSARCTLEVAAETVVRFSHESAGSVEPDAEVAAALAEQCIRMEKSGAELLMVFPVAAPPGGSAASGIA